MSEAVNHQASGLMAISQFHAARLMAVVSHGDEAAELPLLWRICAALTRFGYPVTVLDGTSRESATNPGLAHMLDGEFWPDRKPWDSPAWSIVPAAGGLHEVGASAATQRSALQRLGGLFPSESVVIVYAKAEAVSTLLRHTDVQPLLACGAIKGSLLTSYLALKQLFAIGQLTPTTVCVDAGAAATDAIPPAQLASKLMECTRHYLGLEITVKTMKISDDDAPADPDLQRLVLRMLENSAPIPGRGLYAAMDGRQSGTGIFVRGH